MSALLDLRTKFVVTIGPASESEEKISELITAGMNVARFNTKHNEPSWHREVIQRVHKIADSLQKPVAVLLDLQGPEVRITIPNTPCFDVQKGERVLFTANATSTEKCAVIIPQTVIDSLNVGNNFILEDGACEFNVVEKMPTQLMAAAVDTCVVNTRKTLNSPGISFSLPSLLPRDLDYLDAAKEEKVEFVGLSFVRNKKDIEILRSELQKRNMTSSIVAKIETQQALDNLQEIIDASDAVMIARGDLGVEIPFEQLPYWQKKIIVSCRDAKKPVITATQMLYSMTDHVRPTRAEVNDVANAVYDGTDAVMLSEESAIGKYPVKSLETLVKIVAFAETHPLPL